jgi:hypothetical protein
MRFGRNTLWGALCAAPLVSAACGPPCKDDALDCEAGNEFMLAEDCELSGALEVELGQGQDEFSLLAPLQEPTLYEGAQGGHHFWLALRVDNAALDYPLIQVVFDAEVFDEDRCGTDPECDPWIGTGHRELTLGPELPLNDDGVVEQTSLLLVISIWPVDVERRLRLFAEDECGREAMIEHDIDPSAWE